MSDSISTLEHEVEAPPVDEQPPSPVRFRNRRTVKIAVGVAVTAGVVIAVACLVSAVNHQAAIDAYAQTASTHDARVDEYTAAAAALTDREALAVTEVDGFMSIIQALPDDVIDPTAVKHPLVEVVDTLHSMVTVPESDADASPVSAASAPTHARKIRAGSSTDEITAATGELASAARSITTDTTDLTGKVRDIDEAYDAALVQLDGAMAAARTWGDRDVYEKDTPEQTAALIAAAQALVKPKGETFTGLADRTDTINAFVAARADALAGHEQAVAAEAEAARQAAAAEAERQAANQRPQYNNSDGNRGSSGSTGGGSPGPNTNGSGGSIPQGGGRPGGGTNNTNDGCWTSNGAGGTKPC